MTTIYNQLCKRLPLTSSRCAPKQDLSAAYADLLSQGQEFSVRGVQRRNPQAHASTIFTAVFRCAHSTPQRTHQSPPRAILLLDDSPKRLL